MRVFTWNQFCINEKIAHVNLETFAEKITRIYDELPLKQEGTITVNIDGKEIKGTVDTFWGALNKSNAKLFKQIESKYHVEFVEEDPYETAEQMRKEVKESKILKIYKGDSEHPFFTEEENWRFRAVHDYYTHIIHGENFNLRGEIRAYNTHSKLAPPMALPAGCHGFKSYRARQVCNALPEKSQDVIRYL